MKLKKESETYKKLESALQFGLGNGETFKPDENEINDIYNICIEDLADNLFYNSMHFKSDSNPFSEDGECQVVDGYAYCEKSIKGYLKSII